MNIKITNKLLFNKNLAAVKQPDGVDYDLLLKQLSNNEKVNIKDCRKTKKVSNSNEININESEKVKDIKKDNIIPIPGLVIEYENSESDWMPSSEWHTPHGPQWTPMRY